MLKVKDNYLPRRLTRILKNGLACCARKFCIGCWEVFQGANSLLFEVMADFRNRVLSVNSTPK